MLVRQKQTRIAETIPPVAELIEGKRTHQWHFDLHGKEVKLEFADLVDRDPYRIPLPLDREGYQTLETSHFYWSSGYMDWLNVNQAIEELKIRDPGSSQPLKIFDVGCASGRFLRHAHSFGGDQFDVWGSDLAPANINWIKKYLPPEIKAMTNTMVPHLPFPDRFFDVVTAFSMLPHLEHLEDAWLMELCRITRPAGLMYLTIANESTWADAVNRPTTLKHFERSNKIDGNDPMTVETFAAPMPSLRFVRRTSAEDVYNCYIWHSNAHVEKYWTRYINIERIVDFAHARHHAVVLARPGIW